MSNATAAISTVTLVGDRASAPAAAASALPSASVKSRRPNTGQTPLSSSAPADRPDTRDEQAVIDIRCRSVDRADGARCQLLIGHHCDHAAMICQAEGRAVQTWDRSQPTLTRVEPASCACGLPWAPTFPQIQVPDQATVGRSSARVTPIRSRAHTTRRPASRPSRGPATPTAG